MQVLSLRPGFATVRRGTGARPGDQRDVRTALVEPVAVGDWLLVFLDDAREHLSPTRAAEITATLALVEAALAGDDGAALHEAGEAFDLPSRWTPEQLEAFR